MSRRRVQAKSVGNLVLGNEADVAKASGTLLKTLRPLDELRFSCKQLGGIPLLASAVSLELLILAECDLA